MKGTGSRGVQIFPRSNKFRDNFDDTFRKDSDKYVDTNDPGYVPIRPRSGSSDKSTESLEEEEKELDPAPGVEGFML